MLVTEKGYDDFLAEEIRLGLEDIDAGRVVTAEELKAEMKQWIKEAKRNIEQDKQFEREMMVAYG